MKRIFYIEGNIEQRVYFYHLLGFLLALPFDRFYSTIILLSLFMHSLIYFRPSQVKNIPAATWVFQSVFFVSIFSAIYANSYPGAMNTIVKQLAVFLFPLLLAWAPISLAKYRPKLLMGFSLCCTLIVVYLFADAFRVMRYQGIPPREIFSPAFVNHNFSLPIGLHATYLSMFIVMSIVYLLTACFGELKGYSRILVASCCLMLVAGLIQLSSKSAICCLLLILIAFPFFVFEQRKRSQFWMATIAISIVLLTTSMSVAVFRERLIVDFKKDLVAAPETDKKDWRMERWKVAFDLISRHPIIGSGTGTEIPLLRELYYERKMYVAYLSSLNAHNQYLSFLINSGVLGLFLFLFTLAWGFWKAISCRDVLLFAFMVMVAVVSLGEDILDVNKGIFFYGFFFSFLCLSMKRLAA